MKLISIPQPWAGYVVAGWMTTIVLQRRREDARGPLVIVGDDRRTDLDPPRSFPSMAHVEHIPRLCDLVGYALGAVEMRGCSAPDETDIGIPYLRPVKYFLNVAEPMIYADMPDFMPSYSMSQHPQDIRPALFPPRELVTYRAWRRAYDQQHKAGGQVTPGRDGWTGD